MSSLDRAMKEETFSLMMERYPYWDRSLGLTRYQMNRAAINDDWSSISLMRENLPYTREDLSEILMFIDDLKEQREGIITLTAIRDLQRSMTLSGSLLDITDRSNSPLIIEHCFHWWNTHKISEIIIDTTFTPEQRLAIALSSKIPLTEEIIDT